MTAAASSEGWEASRDRSRGVDQLGEGGVMHRRRVAIGSFEGTSPPARAADFGRVTKPRKCSEAPFVANRVREKVRHRGERPSGAESHAGLRRRPERRSRPHGRRDRRGLEERRSSGWMSALQVTALAAVRRPRVLERRSHLDSAGEHRARFASIDDSRERRTARGEGDPAGSCSEGSKGPARSGLEKGSTDPK